jgi:ElaB/YqjD/DUF883 family membrane-anchored ribosome-binding protein
MRNRDKSTVANFESIKEELARIGDDLTSLGNTLGETASAETRATIDTIRGRLNNIASELGTLADAGVTTVKETIEENPIASVAIALGLGVFLGSALRR